MLRLSYNDGLQTDDIFYFFPESRIWYFMQIVSVGDNMHDMSKPAVWEKYEKYYNMMSAAKILSRVLRVKQHPIKCSL